MNLNTSHVLAPKSQYLDQLTELLPISDASTHRTYLIRHGESTANVYFEVDGKRVRTVSGKSTSIPLTDDGRKQIQALAEQLAKLLPKQTKLIIVSSSAERTKQSAKILFDELSKEHTVTLASEIYKGLNERGLGNWEGLIRDDSYEAAEKPWKALPAAAKWITPEVEGADRHKDVGKRAVKAIAEIRNRYSDYTVIAFTSFNVINATAIKFNKLKGKLSTEPKTDLPKLNLGNGDMVLLETSQNHTSVVSHIKA